MAKRRIASPLILTDFPKHQRIEDGFGGAHDVASSLFIYRFVALAKMSTMIVLRLCFFLSASAPTMRSIGSGMRTCTD